MSLKVWLPLNGTLENKGLLSLTSSTNIGAVINNNGKIGNCYSFNGSNQRIEFTHDKTIWNNKEMSICMWYKYIEGNTTCTMIDIAADLCLSYTYSSSQVRFNYWRAYSNNGTRTGDSGSGNYYDASKWHHVVLTCDHNMNKIYVDGTLDATFDRSSKYTTNWVPLLGTGYNKITLAKSAGSNPYGSGYLNDVRIYDHCLSPLEIKEIAQGLVLHYKLDDAYIESTTNLCGTNAGGWNNSGTCTRTTNDTAILYPPTSSNTYSIRATSNGSMALTCGTTIANHPSKTIIASVYVWLDGTQDSSSFYLRSSKTDSSVGNLTYNGNANPSTWPQRQWIRINTAPIATASDATTFYICTYVTKNTEVRAVNGWQIEEKNHITPYTAPGTTRSTGISIQDSSGYGYNGEVISELYISNDSARYKNSTLFDGVDDCIIVPYNTVCPENIFTINLWFKKDALGSKNYETLFGGPSGFEMDTRAGSATSLSLYMASTRSGNRATGITMNEWHMITMIRDGTTEKYYVDGEFKSEIEAKPMPNGVYRIGAWASNTGQNYYGLISDFRIYATALLDADIKKLYNTSMSIDNNQNIHVFESNENKANKLTKSGILYDGITESYLTLPDGSNWKLLLYHYVDYGNNLFTSSNATYCNDFGLYSRLQDINKYMYDGKYEFYVIQDGTEYRWTQTSQPTASSIAGLTTVSGYTNPVNGLAKANQSNTYIGYGSWWGACGCWTKYSTGGKTGIPGFGPHNAQGICEKYLALYVRIPSNENAKLKDSFVEVNELIER